MTISCLRVRSECTPRELIVLTSSDGADQEIPAAEFVDSHIEDLRQRLALLVDVG